MARFRPPSLKIEEPVEQVEWSVDSILEAYYPKDIELQENIKSLRDAIKTTDPNINRFILKTTESPPINGKIIVPKGITLPKYGAYDNEIKCSVWGGKYGNDGRWIKIYNTIDRTEFVEVAWLTEIYFQNLARSLNSECGFTSPEVYDYGKFSSSNGTFFILLWNTCPNSREK